MFFPVTVVKSKDSIALKQKVDSKAGNFGKNWLGVAVQPFFK